MEELFFKVRGQHQRNDFESRTVQGKTMTSEPIEHSKVKQWHLDPGAQYTNTLCQVEDVNSSSRSKVIVSFHKKNLAGCKANYWGYHEDCKNWCTHMCVGGHKVILSLHRHCTCTYFLALFIIQVKMCMWSFSKMNFAIYAYPSIFWYIEIHEPYRGHYWLCENMNPNKTLF
jgi:hypothetical protein